MHGRLEESSEQNTLDTLGNQTVALRNGNSIFGD